MKYYQTWGTKNEPQTYNFIQMYSRKSRKTFNAEKEDISTSSFEQTKPGTSKGNSEIKIN